MPDHLDNCPRVANGDQGDLDGDRVGDACDIATCGNGIVEYDEQCDGASAAACTGPCQSNCRCAECDNQIADPNAKVIVKTKSQAGQLVVSTLLPLTSYGAEPVTIRLDDADSSPIVQATLASLLPQGKQGIKWHYRAMTDGLRQVILTKKRGGSLQLGVVTRKWFTPVEANGSAAQTHLTVTIGTQCFTRAATKKID